MSDLKTLREFVANVLDYSPDNTTYSGQVDRLLNEADRSIQAQKPYTFLNRVVGIQAYADREAELGFVDGSRAVTSATSFFTEWMVNQILEVNEVEYTITAVVSATDARLERAYKGTSANFQAKVINRYLDLPEDCTTVLGLARRTNTMTPNDPGALSPITRYEDEWHNLPLGEVNLPLYWLPYDPAFVAPPRLNFSMSTAIAVAAGERTVDFCSTFIRGGRESVPGEVVTLTASSTQDFVLTPFSGVTNDGLKKRYYWRAPTLGYEAWRLLDDPTTGGPMELAPADVTPRTLVALRGSSLTGGEALYASTRLTAQDGFRQRVRLYPRQDKDYTFEVRYMERHQPMFERNDTSSIPPEHRMLIAYKALADILIKHNNPTQSQLYARRFDEMLLVLDKRYLITPQRRIVKGNWLNNMEPNSFSRFRTLVHL